MLTVIFDRDGVIIDTEYCHVASVTAALKKYGHEISAEDKKYIAGRHPDDYQKYLLARYDFSFPEYRAWQRKEFCRLFEDIKLIQPAVELIKRLHQAGITLALTTSGSGPSTTRVLAKAGLTGIFQEVVTKEHYLKKKPDPESYLLTAKKLGVKPEECVVIEDSEVGLIAAKAAGMKCVAIPNEYTREHDFSQADLIVKSASEITLEVLDSLK